MRMQWEGEDGDDELFWADVAKAEADAAEEAKRREAERAEAARRAAVSTAAVLGSSGKKKRVTDPFAGKI